MIINSTTASYRNRTRALSSGREGEPVSSTLETQDPSLPCLGRDKMTRFIVAIGDHHALSSSQHLVSEGEGGCWGLRWAGWWGWGWPAPGIAPSQPPLRGQVCGGGGEGPRPRRPQHCPCPAVFLTRPLPPSHCVPLPGPNPTTSAFHTGTPDSESDLSQVPSAL